MGRTRRLRYRHLRRTAIALLVTVAVLLVLGLVALRVLHSDWMCRRAATHLEGLLGVAGIDAAVGSLSWELLPPRLVVEDTVVASGGVTARLDRASVSLAGVRVVDRTVVLEPMPPHERRIIHLVLRDNPNVTTESVGDRDRRKVTIIPRH